MFELGGHRIAEAHVLACGSWEVYNRYVNLRNRHKICRYNHGSFIRDSLHWANVERWGPVVLKMPQVPIWCSIQSIKLIFEIDIMKLVVLTKLVLVKW
jgi:hypothetical protein